MKLKLRIAVAALLATAMAPAWAVQLGQIEVKSSLNQPLVAAIPLHPENLSELEGLTVNLASPADFARAGLQVTATDRTLRFHVATDNNGQKLILVTSSQPVTDPYLDFLLEVNTRQAKQVHEFVVLLNPVIAAPAPAVQTAPVATAPVAAPPPPVSQPAELPTAEAPQPAPQATATPPQPKPQAEPQRTTSTPQPQAQPAAPQPRAAAAPPAPSPAGGTVPVQRGDTLYGIAKDVTAEGGATINQMMLALKSANPEAFFKDNINDLKAGAILRIPTRDEIDRTSMAEANVEVHRQYEAWRAAKPHAATVVEGTAANAAARTAPQPAPVAPESDHLALVPPTGEASGAGSTPGVAGGTGSGTVAALQQRLQDQRGTLASLQQSNADLESRVQSLHDIAGKSDKLLSLKDSTIAALQQKLAAVQSGQPAAAATSAAVLTTSTNARQPAAAATVIQPAAKSAAAQPAATATPWFQRPLTWIVAGLVVLALILAGLLGRRRRGREAPAANGGPLSDPEDLTPLTGTAAYEASLQARLAEHPDDLDAHLALCRLYHAEGDVERFVAAAAAMRGHVREPGILEWHEVVVMGEELAPGDPLFAAPVEAQAGEASHEDAHSMEASPEPVEGGDVTVVREGATTVEGSEGEIVAEVEPEHARAVADAPLPLGEHASDARPEPAFADAGTAGFNDDPVDTKLDLARAYLDMGDPVGARAMLDEVLEEGSQMQQDEARRLLAETTD